MLTVERPSRDIPHGRQVARGLRESVMQTTFVTETSSLYAAAIHVDCVYRQQQRVIQQR